MMNSWEMETAVRLGLEPSGFDPGRIRYVDDPLETGVSTISMTGGSRSEIQISSQIRGIIRRDRPPGEAHATISS